MTASPKTGMPESELAAALLSSGRPFRAEARCARERHGLGRVYLLPAGPVFAVPEVRMLRAELLPDVDEADRRELVFVPWAYSLSADHPNLDAAIMMRCRCHTFSVTPRRLIEKLASLPPDDDWLVVGIAMRRGSLPTARLAAHQTEVGQHSG